MTEAPDSALRYEPIAVTDESTVVAAYTPDPATSRATSPRRSSKRTFIQRLQAQAYERLVITSSADLVANLRTQLEALNAVTFSDAEWERFFTERIAAQERGHRREDRADPGGPRSRSSPATTARRRTSS